MDVVISNTSGVPIYQQLFDQISAQIIKGDLEGGQNLPPIRTAAKELRVSIITVKKAWEELERHGFIYTMVGKGCFVADLNSSELEDKKAQMIREKLLDDLEYYREMGISIEELVEAVRKVY